MERCPFCAAEIQDRTIMCWSCGGWPSEAETEAGSVKEEGVIWQPVVEKDYQFSRPQIRYESVGGWLSLFCLILTFFAPLFTIINLVGSLSQAFPLFDEYTSLLVLSIVSSLVSIGLAGFGIYAGIGLIKIRPNAVLIAKRYLLTILGFSILAFIFPFVIGVNEAMLQTSSIILIRTFIFVAVWYAYLTYSKRVKGTYGQRI